MTEQDLKKIERIKSYCSLSTLIFVGCISTMTYCTTKSKLEEAKANKNPSNMTVSSKAGNR